MAGIEKVCEVCGDYFGGDMYGYKRNRIQVCPGCRKSFSLVGENHTLHIMQPVLYEEYHFGGSSIFNEEVLSQYEHPYKTKEEYLNDITYLKRFVNEYDYVLQVPSVPGKVRGLYQHHTSDSGKMFRKIKRLLHARKLNVLYHNIDLCAWYKNYEI